MSSCLRWRSAVSALKRAIDSSQVETCGTFWMKCCSGVSPRAPATRACPLFPAQVRVYRFVKCAWAHTTLAEDLVSSVPGTCGAPPASSRAVSQVPPGCCRFARFQGPDPRCAQRQATKTSIPGRRARDRRRFRHAPEAFRSIAPIPSAILRAWRRKNCRRRTAKIIKPRSTTMRSRWEEAGRDHRHSAEHVKTRMFYARKQLADFAAKRPAWTASPA